MDFREGARNILHVLPAAKQGAVFDPDGLFTADEIRVGAADGCIIQFAVGEVRSERLVAEERLLMEGKAIPGGAGDSFRLKGFYDGLAGGAESHAIQSQHKEMVRMPGAVRPALLWVNAGQLA